MPTPTFHRAGLPEPSDRSAGGNRAWGGHPGGADGRRPRVITEQHRVALALAAERNGFDSILSITTHRNYDPWIATSFLAAHTSRIKFIVALRPGFAMPTLVAQQAATFQELSDNRLYLNIVTGSQEAELRSLGETLDKERRYARTAEFFDVLRGVWGGAPFDYKGEFYDIENGGLGRPLDVRPTLFMGGSSETGRAVGARHADIHLSYSETPPQIKETVDRVGELADKEGRKVKFGMLISAIVKETADEAWRETDRILDNLDREKVASYRNFIAKRNSVGEARVQSLSQGTNFDDRESLKIYPNIWAGPNRTTLVGSYSEIAERIEEYLSVGVEHFIIGGRPDIESIYEFGEGVIPYFQQAGRDAAQAPAEGAQQQAARSAT